MAASVVRIMTPDETLDNMQERLDNYVPPSERKKVVRTPVKKRPASSSSCAGNTTGSPPAKRTARASFSNRVATPSSVKQEALKNAPKIIFGLDFGTTFSGIAFTWSDQVDKITVLTDIDDSSEESPKVASAINTASLGPDGEYEWGNAAKGKEGSLEWFKLLLVDEDDLQEEVRNSEPIKEARARLSELGQTPEEVISIYLEVLWKQCLVKLKAEVSQATVDLSRFHIVITLPAIWPDYARNRMREATNNAGLLEKRPGVGDTIMSFVSEPEAAALATLKSADGRCDIQVGDSFVVCDCGGGTVDLISYQVTSTEPMMVTEIVKGDGALCGAVFVDDRFKALLKTKINEILPGAWSLVTTEEIQDIMTNVWQKIRGQFKGGVEEWTIRYPYSLIDIEGYVKVGTGFPKFRINSDEVRRVFDPVVKKIRTLVNDQVDAVFEKENENPKYVILVGGFGRCKYLYEYLKKRSQGVEILQSQGAEPWTAICRGAVIHGMTVEKMDSNFAVGVRSRIARASYGIVCQEKWVETKHSEEDRVWDKDQRIWMCREQMKWLITEGQDVMVDRKFRHNFFKLLEDEAETIYTTIWSSKASPPPSRKDASVTKYCEVKWNLKIDKAKLPVFVNNKGQPFTQLDFATEMKCSGGSTEFTIIHNSRRQAAKNVEMEFHDH